MLAASLPSTIRAAAETALKPWRVIDVGIVEARQTVALLDTVQPEVKLTFAVRLIARPR